MKTMKDILLRAAGLFLIFTLLCGVFYTGAVTGFAQVLFPQKANGSMIEIGGVKYGSELLGQYYTDDAHFWGRIMNLDVTTYRDGEGNNPIMKDTAIPVDLVTCSGSGLDPHISPAAAEYQVTRVATASGKSEQEVREIIAKCTDGQFLGIFGEKIVNVLKVNLMLDGIL